MSEYIDTLNINDVDYDIKDSGAYRKPASGIPASDLAEGVIPDVELSTPITYAALKALRDGGNLTPGTWYRITDYHTTVSPMITDVRSADHQFDIIVRADDANHLNENGYAAHNEGNEYFAGCNLEAWELQYCLDNENWSSVAGTFIEDDCDNYHMKKLGTVDVDGTTYILWDASEYTEDYGITRAVSENEEIGTELKGYDSDSGEILDDVISCSIESKTEVDDDGQGTILMLKDEYGNKCPYDFKNIQFKRWCVDDSMSGRTGFTDKYLGVVDNPPANLTIPDDSDFIWAYTFSSDATGSEDQVDYSLDGTHFVYGNVLEMAPDAINGLNDVVFYGEYIYGNHLGVNCNSNTFGNGCQFNSFGNNCSRNSFGNSCSRNLFGNSCYNNSFGNNCYNNSFGNNCRQNSFVNSFQNNSFGNDCNSNSFGTQCSRNSFWNNCYNNSFGSNCSSNSFGNNCQGNSFGNNCYYNSFGNYCQGNSLGNYCQTITVFDGVQFCSVTGGSQYSTVKNAQILNGTAGLNANSKLSIHFTANKDCTQIAALKIDTTGHLTPAQRLVIWYAYSIDGKLDKDRLYETLGFPLFNILDVYSNGDVVVRNSILYQFTEEHIGSWTGNDVIPIDLFTYLDETILGELDNISSAKADKVSNATSGNLAGLDSNGNLTDSGIAASAVATTSDLAGKQDTISDLATIRSGAALGATSIQSSEKGAASGVATLDSGGKVPQSQLPSYVDDVLEYANLASFPATGESGKIYVALDINKTYRWSGSAYVEISQSLAIGETESTAFAGNRGKAIEDKIPSNASSSNKLATDSDVVHKTGAETVAGRKTFSDGIVIALDNNIRFNTDSQGHGVDVFASEDMDNVKHLSLADMEHEDDCRLGGIATPDVSNDAANKAYVDGQVSAKYTKPSGGIPASDLASAVQTSLGKADTALQSFTETDPVFTASAAHGISSSDISNWNAKGTYSKPSGGIPSTDLASAVQTSLGKADTALQSFTESDPVFSASPAAGITSGDISDWDDKAEPIPVVNVSTVPASMDADKFYDYGTLSADIIFPSLNTPSDATKAHVFWWTFKVPATAPNVGWPASGITEWSGGSPPDINASTTYEIMVNNGFASYIMST